MALFTGIHSREALGGLICLSGYLPVAEHCEARLARQTSICIALGLQDMVVMPAWTLHSQQWLQEQGYTHVTLRQYSMEHSVCSDELRDISAWLNTTVQEAL